MEGLDLPFTPSSAPKARLAGGLRAGDLCIPPGTHATRSDLGRAAFPSQRQPGHSCGNRVGLRKRPIGRTRSPVPLKPRCPASSPLSAATWLCGHQQLPERRLWRVWHQAQRARPLSEQHVPSRRAAPVLRGSPDTAAACGRQLGPHHWSHATGVIKRVGVVTVTEGFCIGSRPLGV